MKNNRRIVAFILIVSMLIPGFSNQVSADSSIRRTYGVSVNGGEVVDIPALEVNYDENMFISLKGIAYCLRNTNKSFGVSVSGEEININTGESVYDHPGMWTEEEKGTRPKWKLNRTKVYIDGDEKRFYSLVGTAYGGVDDAFFSPLRLAMALNLDIEIVDGIMSINTENDFHISDVTLENSGYLQGINALLIGDGTTGDIYFEHTGDKAVPIASTTKLMTYFVMMDAVSKGAISLSDNVTISQNAVSLSEGIDGLVSFEGISQVPLTELIGGMLIASCNECALAIAEHVAGSEDAFVEMMNDKAAELELSKAEFYNSNGLPVYEDTILPAKLQNHMTAEDMFKITSELIKTYPEIMEITSTKVMELPTLRYTAKNTNALLYNMGEVKGLKTGTTNKSGACLVTVMPTDKDGETHNLICVLFGAEGEFDRALVAEIANRIALTKLSGAKEIEEEKFTITPTDPEVDVKRMLRNL
ncbi:MAG: serine hydrolase [Lachnospiraceae bacterium]|nr:serine hydrolase [Lachnospiraceae bacterium]